MTAEYNNLVLKDLNYESYLQVPELLGLQREISTPPHHDEMFFIIIHQAAELWFKEILHETKILVQAFREGSVSRALKGLRRITAIADLQVKQINLLNTLTPVEFAGFRDKLRPASGFQSAQFRKIEFTYGLREPFFLKFFAKMPAVVADLQVLLQQPSVYDEFIACLQKAGFATPADLLTRDHSQHHTAHPELTKTIQQIYEAPKENYHWVLLFESMLDFDEKFSLWRDTHILMVSRAIGHKKGTGGSAGQEFLKARRELKFFPDLWEVRNVIGGTY